jgi:uncharacterized protein
MYDIRNNNMTMAGNYLSSLQSGIRKTLGVLLVILSISMSSAQGIPGPPDPPRLVADMAGILSHSENMALENKLVHFNDTTSNQILIIITNELYGYDISEFADRIGDQWGVGQADLDNGVIVVIKPKIAGQRGQAWIAVGHGLEGAIPDITAGHIIDQEMIPYFRENNYYGGLDAATTVLMQLAAGEYTSDEYNKSGGGGWWAFAPFFIFILFFILISRLSRRSRTIGKRNVSPWTAFWLGSMMGSGSSSSSGGSSFGGGGFGGFGGGSFGGGGAGGSW